MKTTQLLLLSLLNLLGFSVAMAQVSINNPTPHPSSILDLSSPGQDDKGVMLPKADLKLVNDVVKTIPAKSQGMMVLDTITNSLFVFDGSNWQKINVFTASSTPKIDTVATPLAITTSKVEIQNDLSVTKNLNVIQDVSVAGKLNVAGYAENALIPSGAIIMWSGTEVPVGWRLCDGKNGTPNLMNKFVLGAAVDPVTGIYVSYPGNYSDRKYINPGVVTSGGSFRSGEIGGEGTVKLTTANLPPHHHEANGAGATITVWGGGEHQHSIPLKDDNNDDDDNSSNPETGPWDGRDMTSYTNKDGAHSHTNDKFGGVVGNGSVYSGLKSIPFSILPPYYTLAYIIKL